MTIIGRQQGKLAHYGVSGKIGDLIIIDDIPPMIDVELQQTLYEMLSNRDKQYRKPDLEPPTMIKNGKRVRRHHPVPATPKRYRK